TDIGPIITNEAANHINTYVDEKAAEGRLLHRMSAPGEGSFVGSALIRVNSIEDLGEEVFGPVLHVATFKAKDLMQVVETINATGYGLTFGLHTRIDDRVQAVADAVHAGNIYANRNQIGAIVGSQPFGGEGLSGTGPKAGGPHCIARFADEPLQVFVEGWQMSADLKTLSDQLTEVGGEAAVAATEILPGPTGELNRLVTLPRLPIICAGPDPEAARAQQAAIKELGGRAVVLDGWIEPEQLHFLPAFGGVIWWGDNATARSYAKTLAKREGPIIPLITGRPDMAHACLERHLCVDTTAAGGNASLLADVGNARREAA
ncbi:MAG: aldehyde dehydrogenase family protein, partial [Pseudomonadota bacterium]